MIVDLNKRLWNFSILIRLKSNDQKISFVDSLRGATIVHFPSRNLGKVGFLKMSSKSLEYHPGTKL